MLGHDLSDAEHALVVDAFAALWKGRAYLVEPDDHVVASLVAKGCCETDRNSIVGIHGLTLRRSPHRILEEADDHHTWCAFDAVGIPAALERDAEVVTTCRGCGVQVSVLIEGGEPVDNAGRALWMPAVTGTNVIEAFCAYANLYCSDDHLRRHISEFAQGEAIPVGRAADLGREVWADVRAVGLD